MEWYEIKIWLENTLELDRDALHIYGAIGIQLTSALIFRRSLASPWPWIVTLLAILLNEYADLQRAGDTEASIAMYREASIHDIWNTMLLPTALLLMARFMPRLLTDQRQYSDFETEESKQSDELV